tara:strand:- start:18029 stop:20053 length:2025 start_codon:yes stop_codon:yes gene_type:complete
MSGLAHRGASFAPDDGLVTDDSDDESLTQSQAFSRSYRPSNPDGLLESVYARVPFTMPKESDVFALREEERVLKASTRARLAKLSVRDKTTFSSRTGSTMGTARKQAEQMLHGTDEVGTSGQFNALASWFEESSKDVGGPMGSKHGAGGDRRQGDGTEIDGSNQSKRPESVVDFVAKKREIFLVQMSLDAKRAEILKLELEASRREEALAASEATLVEDAKRFEEFLRENDLRVQEAVKAGEYEAKRKNDKAQEIKRLAADIVVVEAALGKREEKRVDCERYKAFLDQLTPPEFFEAQDEKRRKRRQERRDKRRAKRDARADIIALADSKEASIASLEAALQEATRRGRTAENAAREALETAKTDAINARSAIPEKSPTPTPENDSSGEETPMYFTDPSQLPEVFVTLEEKNLFLMQNGQVAEEQLEELKASQKVVRAEMESEAQSLHLQIEKLKKAIEAEEAEALALKARDATDEKAQRRRVKMTKKSGGGVEGATGRMSGGTMSGTTSARTTQLGATADFQPTQKLRLDSAAVGASIPLDSLAKKVGETYAKCGFDYDPTMSTVQMLTQIESKLERCLQVADEMNPNYVRESEKAREKNRRMNQRSEKAAVDLLAAEEKAKKALERSMAPIQKKVGKPLMLRSQPPSRKKKIVKEQLTQEEAELRAFLATEF